MTRHEPGDLLARRYLLLEPLAAGGMSVIWRAFDQSLQRTGRGQGADLVPADGARRPRPRAHRGARRRPAPPSGRDRDLRLRRDRDQERRRRGLRRDAPAGRDAAGRAHRRGPAAVARGREHRGAHGPGAGRRARPWPGPPGRHRRERAAHARRAEAARLRDRGSGRRPPTTTAAPLPTSPRSGSTARPPIRPSTSTRSACCCSPCSPAVRHTPRPPGSSSRRPAAPLRHRA